jgi:hypothetical protein
LVPPPNLKRKRQVKDFDSSKFFVFPSSGPLPIADIFLNRSVSASARRSARKPKPKLIVLKELQPILDRRPDEAPKRFLTDEARREAEWQQRDARSRAWPSRRKCTDWRNICAHHLAQCGSPKRTMAETLLLRHPFGVRAGDVQSAVARGQELTPPLKKRKLTDGRLGFGGISREKESPSHPPGRCWPTLERWGVEGPCSAGAPPYWNPSEWCKPKRSKTSRSVKTDAKAPGVPKNNQKPAVLSKEDDEARKIPRSEPPARPPNPSLGQRPSVQETARAERGLRAPVPLVPVPFTWGKA